MHPEQEEEHLDHKMPYDLEDMYLNPDDNDYEIISAQHLKQLEVYMDRLDSNAFRMGKTKITEAVSQKAIRDMIKKAGFTAQLEVKPGESNLRRMDIFGEIIPGENYVVEVKLGFDNFISGVAQLKYYRHLLSNSNIHPYAMILAFHNDEAEKVPFDVYSFCDDEDIIACKAEEVASNLVWQKETIMHWQKEHEKLEADKNINK